MHFSTLAGKHWSETNTGYVHDFDNSCIKTCACRYLVICQFWPSQSSVNQWTNKFPIHLTHSYLIICLPYWITLTFNFTGPSLWVPRFCEDLGQVWEATSPSGRWCETTTTQCNLKLPMQKGAKSVSKSWELLHGKFLSHIYKADLIQLDQPSTFRQRLQASEDLPYNWGPNEPPTHPSNSHRAWDAGMTRRRSFWNQRLPYVYSYIQYISSIVFSNIMNIQIWDFS